MQTKMRRKRRTRATATQESGGDDEDDDSPPASSHRPVTRSTPKKKPVSQPKRKTYRNQSGPGRQGCQIRRPCGSRTSGTSSGRKRPNVRSDVASAR